jgi:uncharacterized C2H2 Zn-finger protein
MEVQEQNEGHICAKCGASFETQEELDRHVASEHGDGGEEAGSKPDS